MVLTPKGQVVLRNIDDAPHAIRTAKADLLTEFDPYETALDRFVKPEKGGFIGKDALLRRMHAGLQETPVSLKVDATHAPAHGGASLMRDGKVVCTITSGDWGHHVGMNVACAFVDPALADPGARVELDLHGDTVGTEVISPLPHDPSYALMRE